MGRIPACPSGNGISATPVVPLSDRNLQEWEISDDEDERLARQVLMSPHGLIEPTSTAEIGGSVRTGMFRLYLYLSILIYKCTPSEYFHQSASGSRCCFNDSGEYLIHWLLQDAE